MSLSISKGGNEARTGLTGVDNVVQEAVASGHVGVCQFFFVLTNELSPGLLRVGGVGDGLSEDDVDGAVGPHDGNLDGGPGEVNVATEVLAAHYDVGTAVGLAYHDADLRYGGFGVGVEELCAVSDDAAVLLVGPRKEAWHVDESDDGDVEGVAEADEAGGLNGGVDVEDAGEVRGLVADEAHGFSGHAGEGHNDVGCEALVHLHEAAFVHDASHNLPNVVGLVGFGRDNVQEAGIESV